MFYSHITLQYSFSMRQTVIQYFFAKAGLGFAYTISLPSSFDKKSWGVCDNTEDLPTQYISQKLSAKNFGFDDNKKLSLSMPHDKTFYPFYEERIHRITRGLQRGYQGKACFTECIQEGIAADLYEVFHRAAVRCLIVELHVCKNEGQLSGETGREEYDSYCGLLTDRQYIDSIYRKYPGLCKYLDELEEIQVSFWREMLGRLSDDWQQIVEYFHFDAGTRILSVRRSGCHHRNESEKENII